MSVEISAAAMRIEQGDASGPGRCEGSVRFYADLSDLFFVSNFDYERDPNGSVRTFQQGNGKTECLPSDGDVSGGHCGTLVHADGRREPQRCTVYARCTTSNTGRSVGYGW